MESPDDLEIVIDPTETYEDTAIVVAHPRERDKLGQLLQEAMELFIAGMAPNTQRTYNSRILAFLEWRTQQPDAPFITQLKRYVAYLQNVQKLSPRSVQAHLNTIKGLLRTAAALEPSLTGALAQLELVKAPRVRGEIHGNRLNQSQAKVLLGTPGQSTDKGVRDTAILGLLLVTGLRRSEICTLTWAHLAELDGHYVIINLKGKHGRVRTLKLPVWLWRVIVEWGKRCKLADQPERRVFLPITKDGRILTYRRGITPHAIYKLVNFYTGQAGLPAVKPHDLRRTAALLARRGGASIEQVQIMLGHASPQTTSSYIGESLDLDDNAVDYSPLRA